MNGFSLSAKHFLFSRRTACRLNNLSKIFALSVALIWVCSGLLPCCELFSSFPTDHHSNYAMAENHHETQEPNSSLPIPCEPMEDQTAVVTDSAPVTKIKNTVTIDYLPSRSAIVIIIDRREAILLAVYHPPPPTPYFLRTSRLLI
jgi:hypothetical protein